MRFHFVIATIIIAAIYTTHVTGDDNIDPKLLIQTTNGPIVGYYSQYSNVTARAWVGIPYAAPPQGELRFRAPTPPESWVEPRDVTEAGPGCQQVCSLPPGLCPPVLSEELGQKGQANARTHTANKRV